MREHFDGSRATIAAALFVAVLMLAAATQFVPWLTRPGEVISSTPVRNDLVAITPVVVRPGERACLADVTLDRAARIARIAFAPTTIGAAPGTELSVEAAGPGYRASTTVPIARGQAGQLDVPFTPPRRSLTGVFCVGNPGRAPFALAGTADVRALTRSTIVVAGRRQPQAFSLTLMERGKRSMLGRASQLVGRAAALTAVGSWLLWLLIPLLLIGVPTAVGAALWLALREPDPASVGPVHPGNRLPLRNTEASKTFPPQGSP